LALVIGALACLGAPPPVRADSEACLSAHERAQLARLRGHYVEAHAELLQCAQAPCPAGVRNDCKGWLSEVEASLPSIIFAVSDHTGRDLVDVRISAGAQLVTEHADGRSLTLNPGLYKLRFEAPGYVTREQEVLVREAEKQRIVRVQLEPEPRTALPSAASQMQPMNDPSSPVPPRSRRLLLASYGLGGAALASLAVGIGFAVSGHDKYNELEDSDCRPQCSSTEVDAGKRRYVIADVAFAMAGAFGISAAVTLILGLRGRDRPPAAVAVDRHGAAVYWRHRF
jgi:hypothetical protein